jgi:hypothetical protein
VSDRNSFRISKGKATLTIVDVAEIARVLGVRVNSVELRNRFEKAWKRMEDEHNCVIPAHLLFLAEHERIGAEFGHESAQMVATIFWHVYAKVNGAIEVLGSPEGIEKMWKHTGCRCVLASQLTGHPSVHRYVYRTADGAIRTALDEQALHEVEHDASAVIDLERIARRLFEVMQRPLITLQLREKGSAANLNSPAKSAA